MCEGMGSSLWFLANLFENMPRARDSGHPGRTSQYRSLSDAAFRSTDGVGVATMYDFGAEPSRPAFLLCTLPPTGRPMTGNTRYRPVCSTLVGRELHPLDWNKRFHHLVKQFLLFQVSKRDSRKYSWRPLEAFTERRNTTALQ